MCVPLHDKQSSDLKILSTYSLRAALLRIVKIAFAREHRDEARTVIAIGATSAFLSFIYIYIYTCTVVRLGRDAPTAAMHFILCESAMAVAVCS